MKTILVVVLLAHAAFAVEEEPVQLSTTGFDSKSCLFLSVDRRKVIAPDFVDREKRDPLYGMALDRIVGREFKPFRSYGGGNPGGLDLYRENPFRNEKVRHVVSYSRNRDHAPICFVYDSGEAYCHGFIGSPGFERLDHDWREGLQRPGVCDVFFVHEKTAVPELGEFKRGRHCRLRIPLAADENVEQMMIADSHEGTQYDRGEFHARAEAPLLRTLCYRTNRGRIKCLGQNELGLLGSGKKNHLFPEIDPKAPKSVITLQPVPIDFGSDGKAPLLAKDACVYNDYGCVVLNSGDVKCWGSNQLPEPWVATINYRKYYPKGTDPKQLGDNLRALPIGGKARSVSCAGTHMCVVREDGALKCFGSNLSGQLGTSEKVSTLILDNAREPERAMLPGDVEATSVITQAGATCAILESGHLSCFGFNHGGILGFPFENEGRTALEKPEYARLDDDKLFPIVPVERGTGIVGACLEPWRVFEPEQRKACVLYKDGTLSCWRAFRKKKQSLADSMYRVLTFKEEDD